MGQNIVSGDCLWKMGWWMNYNFFLPFLFLFLYLFLIFRKIYLFLERGEGREKERRETCVRDTLIGCLLHNLNWVPGLQLRHVPWLGIELATFQFTGRHLIHWATPSRAIYLKKFFFYLLIFRESELASEWERHRFVGPLIYAFIGWFLYVPWLGIEPATLGYGDDSLTNWATWPGPFCCCLFIFFSFSFQKEVFKEKSFSFFSCNAEMKVWTTK